MTALAGVRFASPIDAYAFSEHRISPSRARSKPVPRFTGRLTADGSSGYPSEPGRYHVYAGRFCPRSHRANIVVALNGLAGLVSVSYVDGLRDGRGWAFRERTGPDPVNGFTLLREAYEATEPGYNGDVCLPVLWDRRERRIVSNDADTIDVDLATAFAARPAPAALYPIGSRDQIDELNRQVAALETAVVRAVYLDPAKREVRAAMHDFDRRLDSGRYLLGDTLTLADVRLWVRLVRYDAGANA
jgi:putative glutathione S-transferase